MNKFIVPSSIVLGSIVTGVIFDWIILKQLRRLTKRTKWKFDDMLVKSLKGISSLWFLFAGIYAASFYLGLSDKQLVLPHKVLLTLVIFSVTVAIARVAVGFIKLYTAKKENVLPATSIFSNVTKIVVFSLGILVILQSLGVSITPLLTALGVGGLAVALALQDTLSNLFSGIHIIISKKIRPNDYIKLESGEEGYVEDISWRNTSIRALPNNIVIIPNSKLATAIVVNYNMPDMEIAVLVNLGVSYSSDLEKVEKVTIEVGKEVMNEVAGGVEQFTPFIRYNQFGESSINFTVILRGKSFVDQYLVKHEFIKRLHKRYHAEGIEIPFPIRTVHLKQT